MADWPARSLLSLSPAVKADTPERYQIVRLEAFMPMRAKRAETALRHKGFQPSKFDKLGQNWRTPEPKGGGSGVLGRRQKGVKSTCRWWCRGESRGKPLHQVYYLLFLSLWIDRRVCIVIKPLISLPTVAIRTSSGVIGRLCLAIFVISLAVNDKLVITC